MSSQLQYQPFWADNVTLRKKTQFKKKPNLKKSKKLFFSHFSSTLHFFIPLRWIVIHSSQHVLNRIYQTLLPCFTFESPTSTIFSILSNLFSPKLHPSPFPPSTLHPISQQRLILKPHTQLTAPTNVNLL
jgi:hypothetical protein